MKAKTAVLMMLVIMLTILFQNAAYALRTHQAICVTVVIEGNLSMDLENGWVKENLQKPEAEAFTELKDSGISVDRVRRGDSTLWLFTKTE